MEMLKQYWPPSFSFIGLAVFETDIKMNQYITQPFFQLTQNPAIPVPKPPRNLHIIISQLHPTKQSVHVLFVNI